MEASLKFELPEDNVDFKLAVHGKDAFGVLWDFDNEVLRKYVKYDDSLSTEQYELVEKIREKLYDKMDEHGISFDMYP